MILITAEARPEDLPRMISMWREERDHLVRQGVTLEELARGRAMVQGAYLRSWETNRERAGLLHDLLLFGLAPDYFEEAKGLADGLKAVDSPVGMDEVLAGIALAELTQNSGLVMKLAGELSSMQAQGGNTSRN